jgi:hypothetical protein
MHTELIAWYCVLSCHSYSAHDRLSSGLYVFDDFIFEGEEGAPTEGLKWMALAKVHTANSFSPQAFEHNMRSAWSPAQEVKFQHL